MLVSGTRMSYYVHEDYDSAEGLCIVVDTSSLVNSSSTLSVLERIQQRAAQGPLRSTKTQRGASKAERLAPPHMLVVPYVVVDELQHLTRSDSTELADRARRLLAFFVKCPAWSECPASQLIGITRQKKAESNSSLNQCVRVNDTKIVSCAVYFQGITHRVAGRPEHEENDEREREGGHVTDERAREKKTAARAAEEARVGRRLTVLLTEDTIMGIKAAAYDLPVICFSELVQCYLP